MTRVAVIDIGKTNAKLVLFDTADMSERLVLTRANSSNPAPYPHFDVEGHWQFLIDGLRQAHADHGIEAISVTTHGACVALLDHGGDLATPVLDYEHDGPDVMAQEYDRLRPPFSETGAPRLPGGLNIGAQLHWLFARYPDLHARVAHIVTYPHYWGFRLTGELATDVTSLGCHTDLWNPFEGQFSSLVDRLDIAGKLASPQAPGAVPGTLTAKVAAQTGLPAETPVYCGIHDSNASLLPHLQTRQAPFSVLSSGTWVIALTVGGHAVKLDPSRDTLINVNALGDPVRSARFMGGREFDLITDQKPSEVSEADRLSVLGEGCMLLPSVIPSSGPFQGRVATWRGSEPETGSGQRMVAVSYYLALMAAECLRLTGHQGPVFVEGPFAKNGDFLDMLAVSLGVDVHACAGTTGTAAGAAALVVPGSVRVETTKSSPPQSLIPLLRTYSDQWRERTQ